MPFNATSSALPILLQHNSGGFAFFPPNILSSSFFATSSQIDELVEASASFVLDAGVNNELFFRVPSTASGQDADITILYLTSSGKNPRVGVGTTEPLTVFDFKDIEDSSAGTELLLRSSRTSEGAQIGDSAGRINFVIDSSSFSKIQTSGSIATVEALVSDVDTTGVTGDLVLSTANVKSENPIQRIKIGVTTEITGALNTSANINAKTKISSSTLETSGFLSADSLGVGTTIPPGANTLKVEGAANIDGNSTFGSSAGSITTISGSLKTTGTVYIPGIEKTSGTDNVVIMDSGFLKSSSVDAKIFANPNTLVSRNILNAANSHIPFYSSDTTILTSSTSFTFNADTLSAPGFSSNATTLLIGANVSTANISTTNLTASIISASGTITANTIEVDTDIDITTNNEFLRGKLTGGATRNLIGVSDDNIVVVGNTSVDIQLNNDTSINGDLEVTGSITLEGQNVIDGAKIKVNKSAGSAGDGNGIIIKEGSTITIAGKIYYYTNLGQWTITDADAESSSTGLLGVALGTDSGNNGMLLQGCVTLATDPGSTGDILYLQTDTAGNTGDATSTAPNGQDDIVRIIGYCLDNGKIYFNPSNDFIKHA